MTEVASIVVAVSRVKIYIFAWRCLCKDRRTIIKVADFGFRERDGIFQLLERWDKLVG